MRRSLWWAAVAVVMTAGVGCGGGGEGTDTAAGVTEGEMASAGENGEGSLGQRARQAAEVARAIQGDPDRASEILAEHGLTQEEFEALLFQIAADPEASEIYSGALEP